MPLGEIDDDFLRGAAKILSQLPPPEPKVVKPETQTCVCGRHVTYDKLKPVNTGVFHTWNDVCKGCKVGEEYDRTHARLVCARCKRVIMHLPPSVDKTGFRFEANKSYHVESCPQCDATLKKQSFTIIEKAMWNRTHGIARASMSSNHG